MFWRFSCFSFSFYCTKIPLSFHLLFHHAVSGSKTLLLCSLPFYLPSSSKESCDFSRLSQMKRVSPTTAFFSQPPRFRFPTSRPPTPPRHVTSSLSKRITDTSLLYEFKAIKIHKTTFICNFHICLFRKSIFGARVPGALYAGRLQCKSQDWHIIR